jgi:SET family sugar efflux transporter-like MFS transporter
MKRILPSFLQNAVELSFMGVTFLTGLAIAFLVPVLSLFLSDELHVRPLLVGAFFTANAIAGIVIGQILAHYSDSMSNRKPLIMVCGIAGILGSLLYAFDRHYAVLVSLGIVLMSFCGSITPQLYALAREYTDAENKQAVTFSTVMRAQFSLAWVVGPPLAFFIVAHFDFTRLFTGVAVLYLLCVWVIVHYLPVIPRKASPVDSVTGSIWQNKRLCLLFISSFLLWTCNSMYLITMPLYIGKALHWSQGLAGWLMGLAAGLEIPVMLLAGRYSARLGNRKLLLISAVSAVAFYVMLLTSQLQVWLFLAQILNALFIGILAGIGMTCFQDLLPGHPGQASTLFSNSIRCGGIISGMLAGAITEWFQFQGVFICALALSLCSLLTLWRISSL